MNYSKITQSRVFYAINYQCAKLARPHYNVYIVYLTASEHLSKKEINCDSLLLNYLSKYLIKGLLRYIPSVRESDQTSF